jgi:hypothetical protein
MYEQLDMISLKNQAADRSRELRNERLAREALKRGQRRRRPGLLTLLANVLNIR